MLYLDCFNMCVVMVGSVVCYLCQFSCGGLFLTMLLILTKLILFATSYEGIILALNCSEFLYRICVFGEVPGG